MGSTARASLRKYFIPGCVGRGLDLDMRIRPAAPAASGNPGYTDLAPLGLRSKTRFSNCPADNRSKVSVEKSQIGFVAINFRDLSSHICEIFLWMARSGILDPDKTGFFKTFSL